MNLFIRARLHDRWHISNFYVADLKRRVTEHRTLCGTWVQINQAEGGVWETEHVEESCRRCVQAQGRKMRRQKYELA